MFPQHLLRLGQAAVAVVAATAVMGQRVDSSSGSSSTPHNPMLMRTIYKPTNHIPRNASYRKSVKPHLQRRVRVSKRNLLYKSNKMHLQRYDQELVEDGGDAAEVELSYGDEESENGGVLYAPNIDSILDSGSSLGDIYNDTYSNDGNGTSNDDGNLSNGTFIDNGDEDDETKILRKPIRITPVLAEEYAMYLTLDEQKYLLEEILNPAIEAWSNALWINPVQDTLTLDRNQLWDGVSCGPGIDSGYPSPLVPDEHVEVGLNDTDLVIYVSVSFTYLSSAAPSVYSGYAPSTTPSMVPTYKSMEPTLTPSLQAGLNSDGPTSIANVTIVDGFLNTTHEPSQVPSSGESLSAAPSDIQRGNIMAPQCIDSDTIASAVFCSSDQFDRPIAGSIHFCIDLEDDVENDQMNFFHSSRRQFNIKAAMHELAHVLGFNSQSLAHFRNGDGTPKTPRNDDGDVPDVEIDCAGHFGSSDAVTAIVPLPDPSILNFRTTNDGSIIAAVVTENVKMVAQNFFGCKDLIGADLETYVTSRDLASYESVCIGNHWERRLYKDDLMNPIVDPPTDFSLLISPLTLAYFVDSGWYNVNLDQVAPSSRWGRQKGCDFALGPCVVQGSVPQSHLPFFCSGHDDAKYGCSDDMLSKASCGIYKHETEIGQTFEGFQHFGIESYDFDDTDAPKETWIGGNDPALDYCPVFEPHKDSLCVDSESAVGYKTSNSEEFGVINSRCIANGLCVPIACVRSDYSLRVKVSGEWKLCSHKDEKVESSLDSKSFILCPDPKTTCPLFFCANDCLGTKNGECDSSSGLCMCKASNDPTNLVSCEDKGLLSTRAFAAGKASTVHENSVEMSIYIEDPTELQNDVDEKDEGLWKRIRDIFSDPSGLELVGIIGFAVSSVLIIVLGLWWFRRKRIHRLSKNAMFSSIIRYFRNRRGVNSDAVRSFLGFERTSIVTDVSSESESSIDLNIERQI